VKKIRCCKNVGGRSRAFCFWTLLHLIGTANSRTPKRITLIGIIAELRKPLPVTPSRLRAKSQALLWPGSFLAGRSFRIRREQAHDHLLPARLGNCLLIAPVPRPNPVLPLCGTNGMLLRYLVVFLGLSAA